MMTLSAYSAFVLAVYIFTFVAGLPSNLLALYSFLAKARKKLAPIDIFLLNLTVSDVILLLILPIKMLEASSNMSWPLPHELCPLTGFSYFSSIYISTQFLMAISVERYLGIAYPIKYKMKRRPAYAVAASIFFWLMACSRCSIVYVVQYVIPMNRTELAQSNISICYDKFTPEQLRILLPVRLELCVTLFILPFLITLFCYLNLIHILTSSSNIQTHRKQRAVGLALVTLLNFAICFAPYNISHIVGFIQNQSPSWRIFSLLPSTLNASLDPVIFYFSSSTVRRTYIDFFTSIGCKLQAFMPGGYQVCLPCCGAEVENSGVDRSSVSNLAEIPSERIGRG